MTHCPNCGHQTQPKPEGVGVYEKDPRITVDCRLGAVYTSDPHVTHDELKAAYEDVQGKWVKTQ